jgi:hypothetical protein
MTNQNGSCEEKKNVTAKTFNNHCMIILASCNIIPQPLSLGTQIMIFYNSYKGLPGHFKNPFDFSLY